MFTDHFGFHLGMRKLDLNSDEKANNGLERKFEVALK